MNWMAVAGPGLAASLVTGLFSPFLEPESKAAREGLDRYAKGEYVEAVDRFQKALGKTPDPRVQYDLGSAAFQGQNYPEAAEAYGSVVGADGIPPGHAAYNLGNVLFRGNKLEEALKAYRQALRENPDDEDARFNYELTQRRLSGQDNKDQNKNKEKQNEQSSDADRNGEQNAPPDSSGQSSSQDQKKQQQDTGTESGNKPKQDKKGSEGQAPPRDKEPGRLLSPEEAQRLLNAVTPEERELIQARLKAGHRRQVEKDW